MTSGDKVAFGLGFGESNVFRSSRRAPTGRMCLPLAAPLIQGFVRLNGFPLSMKAREQLRALPKEQRRNLGRRIEEMREDLRGDVRKLQAKGNYYRLRVGNFRVLFLLAGNAIQVYAVKDRKEAYE
jgi:mRNA interferase RelE/StbE